MHTARYRVCDVHLRLDWETERDSGNGARSCELGALASDGIQDYIQRQVGCTCVSTSLCLPHYISASLHLYLTASLPHSTSLSLCLYLTVSLAHCISASLWLTVWVHLCLAVAHCSVHLCLAVAHCVGARASQLVAPGFDPVGLELYPFLTLGASIHVVPDDVRAVTTELLTFIAQKSVSVALLPTPIAELAIEHAWPADSRSVPCILHSG